MSGCSAHRVASHSTLDRSITSAMGSFLCHLLLETESIRVQYLGGTQWIFSSHRYCLAS